MAHNDRSETTVMARDNSSAKSSMNIEEYASGKNFEKYASYILEESLEKIATNLHWDVKGTVDTYVQFTALSSRDTRPSINSAPLYKYVYQISLPNIIETLSTFSFVVLFTSESVIVFRTSLLSTKSVTRPDSFLVDTLLRVSEPPRAVWEDFVDYDFDQLTCYVEDPLVQSVDIFALTDSDAVIDDKTTYKTFRPLSVGKRVPVSGIRLTSSRPDGDLYSVLHAQRGQFTSHPTATNITNGVFKLDRFYARAVILSCLVNIGVKDTIVPVINEKKMRKILVNIMLTYFSRPLFRKMCESFSDLKRRKLVAEAKHSKRRFLPTWFSGDVLKKNLLLWDDNILDELLSLEATRKLVGVSKHYSNFEKVSWIVRNSKNSIETLVTLFRKREDPVFLESFVQRLISSSNIATIELLARRKSLLRQLVFNEFERMLLAVIGGVEYTRVKEQARKTGRSLINIIPGKTVKLIQKRLSELKKYYETVSQNACIHVALLSSVYSVTQIPRLRALYDRLSRLMQERLDGQIYCIECNIYMMCKHQKLLFEEKLHGKVVTRDISNLQVVEDNSVICRYCGELFFTVPKDNEEDLSSALSKLNRWRTDSVSDVYELTIRQTIILLSRDIRMLPPPNARDIATYAYMIIGDTLRALQSARERDVKTIGAIANFSRTQELSSIYYARMTVYAVCVSMHVTKRAFVSFNLARRPKFAQELVKDITTGVKLTEEEISQLTIASRSLLDPDLSFMLADTIREKFRPDENMHRTALREMIQVYSEIKQRGGLDATRENITLIESVTIAFDPFTLLPFVRAEKVNEMFKIVRIAEKVQRKVLNSEAFEYDIQQHFILPIVDVLRANNVDEKIINTYLLADTIPPQYIIIKIWLAFVSAVPTVPVSWRVISRTFAGTYRDTVLLDDILEHLLYTAPRHQTVYHCSLRHLTKEVVYGHSSTSVIPTPQIKAKSIDDAMLKTLWSEYCLVETDNELLFPHEFIGGETCNRCRRTYNEINYISEQNLRKFRKKLNALAKLVIGAIKIFPQQRIAILEMNKEAEREIKRIVKNTHVLKENIHSMIMQICAVHDARLHDRLIERLTTIGKSTKDDINERTLFVVSLARKVLSTNSMGFSAVPLIYIYIMNYVMMINIDAQGKYLASVYALLGVVTLTKKADKTREIVSYILETEQLLTVSESEITAYRRRIEYEEEKRHMLYLKGDLMDKIRTGLEYMIGAEQEQFFAQTDEQELLV
jgi:hypothetical protein